MVSSEGLSDSGGDPVYWRNKAGFTMRCIVTDGEKHYLGAIEHSMDQRLQLMYEYHDFNDV